MKAIWNGTVFAESDQTLMVGGNHYFPPESIKEQFFKSSESHTFCLWRGPASYYDVVVEGKVSEAGAWYYPAPFPMARKVRGYVAFWRGVIVQA